VTSPLRLVALIAPRWCGATALAATLSALAPSTALPPGVIVPTDGAWFGRFRDGVTVHPELVELSGASRDTDGAIGPVVRRDGESATLRARPPQSRQVVRDRLRRVIEDARGASAHTVLLVAPGAVWQAEPQGLHRELSGLADRVDIGMLVRAPERALASALAHRVRLADVSGVTSLSARTALGVPELVNEFAYGEALAHWSDGVERAPVLVPSDRGVEAVWSALRITLPAGGADASGGSSTLDPETVDTGTVHPGTVDSSTSDAGTVLPPLSRADLEHIAAVAGRRALTRSGREKNAAALAEARDAADERALAGAQGRAAHIPFAFSDDEVRTIRRRYRRDLAALENAASTSATAH